MKGKPNDLKIRPTYHASKIEINPHYSAVLADFRLQSLSIGTCQQTPFHIRRERSHLEHNT